MKLALAIDTSTRRGSVAVGPIGTGDVLAEESLEVSATHSETVLPAIDRLLSGIGGTPVAIVAVVVGSGPGSFTGVRIGAALSRGLCYGGRAELFAYSSLAATAVASGLRGAVCALLDAGRGQVYAAGYEIGPDAVSERVPPHAGALVDLLPELDPHAWSFAAALPDAARRAIDSAGGRLCAVGAARPTGAALLRLLALDPSAGRVADPARWEPEYVRGSSAERRLARD